ncbi:MAG: hypothetical protein O7G85_13045 [Planctomycetota bacterium]|nr:hypothetical protein [Planctomycetota bacterium]
MPDDQDFNSPEYKSRQMFEQPAPPTPAPPPIQMNRGKVVTLVVCGTILTTLLMVVLMNIQTGTGPVQTPVATDDIKELVPTKLTSDEIEPGGINPVPMLPKGGMIEVARENGTLAQEYRFQRLEPRPEGRPAGWLEMVKPFAVMYGSDGQVTTLSSDVALANAPNRALESGTLTGNVVIRLFEGEPGWRFVEGELDPSAVIKTDKAIFDNVIGEILCEGLVDITSATVDLMGNGFKLQINDLDEIAQLWRVEKVHYIRFHATKDDEPPVEEEAKPSAVASIHEVQTEQPRIAKVGEPESRNVKPRLDGQVPTQPTQVVSSGIQAESSVKPQAGKNRTRTSNRRKATKSLDEVQFYRLTLSENVRIVQDDMTNGKLAIGDELNVVFSFESKGLGDMLAFAPHSTSDESQHGGGMVPMTRDEWLASLVIASMQDPALPQLNPGDTLITCDGPLVMVPLKNISERPATASDARVTLLGAPVVLRDLGADTEVRGGSFVYNTENRRIQLTRSADHPVLLESPDYTAQGEHLWINQAQHEARFEGPGWLASAPGRQESLEQDPAPTTTPEASDSADPLERLRINWEGGVHLDFLQTSDNASIGPLQTATFEGEVKVRGDEGEIDCQRLELNFTQNAEDKTVPLSMIASGDARLRSLQSLDQESSADGPQTIWADLVTVTFLENSLQATETPVNETTSSANPFGDGTEVDTLYAKGDVQVLLANGTRIFADTLDGNAKQEEVTLLGENIVFVSGQVIIERGTKVTMVKSDGSADWPGAGMARIFTKPIDVSADRRIERPVIANDTADNPRQVRARWEKSMRFEGNFNNGAGRLLLAGNVDTMSTPTRLEKATMTGDTLELQFVAKETEGEQEPSDSSNPMSGASRTLGKLIAKGNARIESRKQYESHPDVLPQIFYIEGEHIEYDDRTFESIVNGPGQMLIRDLLPDETDASGASNAPFSGKGTTRFKWTERLAMKHIVDDYYEMTMIGEVEGVHLDLARQRTTITGRSLMAGIRRQQVVEQRETQEGALLVGSGMDLQKVSGKGGLFVQTPTRDVMCHEFDYNLITKMASAKAAPRGRVSIKTRGEANPVYADRIDWNMVTDRIEVIQGGGTTAR